MSGKVCSLNLEAQMATPVTSFFFLLLQLIEEFRRATLSDKANRQSSLIQVERGSLINPLSKELPTMKLEDFNLLVVLGKGSFGKVGGWIGGLVTFLIVPGVPFT